MIRRIKAVLAYSNMTETQFAKRLGVTQSSLNRTMRGATEINFKLINAILTEFDEISAEWLMRGTGTMLAEDNAAAYNKRIVAVRQNWLTPDQVRFIRDHDDKHKAYMKFRDLFMLSYYLGGINIIDLAHINFNECTDTLKYIRAKTERKAKVNPYVEFEIPAEAKPIIEKYKCEDGRLNITNSNDIDHCHIIGETARRFRDDLGLPNLTFYSARKSFAQHAFALGESESVIDYVLGHSLGGVRNKMLFAYIKVTPAMATACVRKVCDFIATDKNF